ALGAAPSDQVTGRLERARLTVAASTVGALRGRTALVGGLPCEQRALIAGAPQELVGEMRGVRDGQHVGAPPGVVLSQQMKAGDAARLMAPHAAQTIQTAQQRLGRAEGRVPLERQL